MFFFRDITTRSHTVQQNQGGCKTIRQNQTTIVEGNVSIWRGIHTIRRFCKHRRESPKVTVMIDKVGGGEE